MHFTDNNATMYNVDLREVKPPANSRMLTMAFCAVLHWIIADNPDRAFATNVADTINTIFEGEKEGGMTCAPVITWHVNWLPSYVGEAALVAFGTKIPADIRDAYAACLEHCKGAPPPEGDVLLLK